MNKNKIPNDQAIADMSFEKALAELNSIVTRMEEGEVALQESIGQYERAMKLYQKCVDELATAKLKIEQLVLDSNKNIAGKKKFPTDDNDGNNQ